MQEGEKVEVDLIYDNNLMKTIIDRFEEEVTIIASDMTSFCAITEVEASPTFLGSVFGFAGKVQILVLDNVKEEYKKIIMQSYENII